MLLSPLTELGGHSSSVIPRKTENVNYKTLANVRFHHHSQTSALHLSSLHFNLVSLGNQLSISVIATSHWVCQIIFEKILTQ